MGIAASLALLIGLSLAMALIAWQGFGEVVHALASAGWGLLVIAAFHLAPMLINTRAWSTLFRLQDRLSFPRLLVARWIGESINSLLPVAQIGGELAKARWIAHLGIDANVAGASAVLDLTIAVLTQIIFTLLGLLLLVLQLGNDDLLFPAILGTVSISVLLAGFYIAQRRGMFEKSVVLITHLAPGREGWGIHGSAVALDAAIHAMYRNRKRLAVASAWRLCGWIIGAGEVWLAMIFLKLPVTPAQALLLESLGQAARAAGFLIPASLGVQEGGFLLLGTALGIPPHTSLALSLAKRVRELLLGLPGLALWQLQSGRRLWKRHRSLQDRPGNTQTGCGDKMK